MSPLDDLPERHPTHDTALAAKSAFEAAIAAMPYFLIQQKDRHDYGTDFQFETRQGTAVTNFRMPVQLKGTDTGANADGSVSIQVARRNLNYLLNQSDAIYICFHRPTNRLLARYAADVFAEYEQPGWQARCLGKHNRRGQTNGHAPRRNQGLGRRDG